VHATLELLLNEVAQRQIGYEQAISSLATKLMLDTFRAVAKATGIGPAMGASDSSQGARVNEMERYLRQNYTQKILASEVAEQIHLSTRHANRIFQELTGKTINEYLTDLRMNYAEQLLLRRELPIKQIAWMCGYKDYRYFSKQFQQHRGRKPSVYRLGEYTKKRSRD
jgi:transcriptional regulator GlxA family with amidase domain